MYKKKIFIIGFLFVFIFSGIILAQEESSEDAPPLMEAKEEIQKTEDPVKAEEEPQLTKSKARTCKCRYNVDTPYKERRTRWGGTFGFQWGAFRPVNFTPTNNALTYDGRYGTGGLGSIEMVVSTKLNFVLGSIGPQITAGSFSATNATTNASLSIIPITAGIIYSMDNILKEPYIVPYGVFGVYSAYYRESLNGSGAEGTAPIGMFYSAGVMFQLDWMDDDSHESGYEEYGMENTFLYVEGRSFLQAPIITNTLTDMSTPLQLFAGLKVEF